MGKRDKNVYYDTRRLRFFGVSAVPKIRESSSKPAFAPEGMADWQALSYDHWCSVKPVSTKLGTYPPDFVHVKRRCERGVVQYLLLRYVAGNYYGWGSATWGSADDIKSHLVLFMLTGELPEKEVSDELSHQSPV